MKLQINTSGAWRDVMRFEPEQLAAIKEATVPLSSTACYPFRIVESRDGSTPRVVASLDNPFTWWKKGQ